MRTEAPLEESTLVPMHLSVKASCAAVSAVAFLVSAAYVTLRCHGTRGGRGGGGGLRQQTLVSSRFKCSAWLPGKWNRERNLRSTRAAPQRHLGGDGSGGGGGRLGQLVTHRAVASSTEASSTLPCLEKS